MSPLDIDSALVSVPFSVARCPYCQEELHIVGVEEWTRNEDGSLHAEKINLVCSSEPDGEDGEGYNAWLSRHSQMPYVYWLPIEEKVTRWFNEHFTLVRRADDERMLEKWIKAVQG